MYVYDHVVPSLLLTVFLGQRFATRSLEQPTPHYLVRNMFLFLSL
jgi:hypothetical protein